MLQSFVDTYDPTIEDDFRMDRIVDGHPYDINILDTAGKYVEYLIKNWIEVGDGFLLVYDTGSRKSFHHVEVLYGWIQELWPENGGKPPVVIVANMIDRKNLEVASREGSELAKHLECGFVETSAKNPVHATEAFHTLVRLVRKLNDEAQHGIEDESKGHKGIWSSPCRLFMTCRGHRK